MMASLHEKTILCLATQEWDAHWTPVQQIALRLAPKHRVIYVEPFHPPFSRGKSPQQKGGRPGPKKRASLEEIHPNLFVYRPSCVFAPLNMRSRVSEWLNGYLYRRELRRVMVQFGGAFILWAFFAQSLSVLDLPFEQVIYDCVDDWPSFFPHARERAFVQRIDKGLCDRANLVFVGSAALLAKKAPLNPNTHVVNHAADIQHFSKAADRTLPIPSDLKAIARPRLGFVGMIDRVRFDAALITRLARNYELEIAIIGGTMPGAEGLLPQCPNLHQLGMRSVSELPEYLRGMDVLLMPYALNEATRNIYPLKLYEYLATGKPVVTTCIPAVEPLRHLMYVADTAEEFFDHVATALREKDDALVLARRAEASTHTWEAHLNRKLELIDTALSTPQAAGRSFPVVEVHV